MANVESEQSKNHRTGLQPRDSGLATTFRIFRSPTETPPEVEKRRIMIGLAAHKERRVPDTQLVKTEQGPLWILHTPRLICISHIRGMACDRRRRAMSKGVGLGVFDPPDEHQRGMHNFLVQGIVPDDVSGVRVSIDNGRQLTVDVEENVFSVAADKPIHIKRLLRD